MDNPIISISEGKLQGTVATSVLGIKYLAFKGIPYAEPPLGPLRFKPPQPPLKWSGVRDASKHAGEMAIQNDTGGPNSIGILGGEDCLYLNVYTNAIGHKRPVMFYIHGGGFVEGTGNEIFYRQDYFITLDMVFVNVNYRLGPMGFLNLGHEVASGNQGLKDILFALKWVQRNIEAFGGDPNNVTIFGNSAGSAVSHLFTLLPAAKGLFHKAIMQSGSILFSRDLFYGTEFKNGFKIASLLGLDTDDPIKAIEFLRTVPARDLVALEGKILSKREAIVLGRSEYGPVFDGDYTNDAIIPLPINELLKNDANVPIIIGHTQNESLLTLIGKFNDDTYKYYNDNIDEIIKYSLLMKDESKFPEILKEIKEFYLKNQPINKDTVWNLINLLTDINMIYYDRKIIDSRNEHANAPTYVYNFNYIGNEPTIFQFDEGPQPLIGVAHADELSYMFYLYYMRKNTKKEQFPKEGTKDRCVMERFIRMWFNFALTGNPTPELDKVYITTNWKPSTKENLYYLDIGEDLTLRDDKDSESRALYEKCSSIMLY